MVTIVLFYPILFTNRCVPQNNELKNFQISIFKKGISKIDMTFKVIFIPCQSSCFPTPRILNKSYHGTYNFHKCLLKIENTNGIHKQAIKSVEKVIILSFHKLHEILNIILKQPLIKNII